jgi:hypothetical protein
MRNRTILLASGLAVALLAGGGTALAASASSGPVSGGVVYGCYTNAAINGSHVIVLQNASTNCPSGTTAVSWNPAGSAGGLDAMIGSPCDTNTNAAGNLSVTYTPNDENGTDAISIVCDQDNPNQQYAVNLTVYSPQSDQLCSPDEWPYTGETCTGGGTGRVTITSQDSQINCTDNNSGTCTGDYTASTLVTLTATLNGDSDGNMSQFGGWAGCDSVSTSGLICTVTVSAVRNVTATVYPAQGD